MSWIKQTYFGLWKQGSKCMCHFKSCLVPKTFKVIFKESNLQFADLSDELRGDILRTQSAEPIGQKNLCISLQVHMEQPCRAQFDAEILTQTGIVSATSMFWSRVVDGLRTPIYRTPIDTQLFHHQFPMRPRASFLCFPFKPPCLFRV